MKKDVSLYFIAKVIIGIIGLVAVTLYSTLMTPEQYGDYSLVSGLVTALTSIFIGWIGSSGLRYFDSYKENKKVFYSNLLLYFLCMLLLIVLVLFVVSFFSYKIPISTYFLSAIFYTFSISSVEVFEKLFRASQKTILYAISMILQSLIGICLFYIFAKFLKLGTNSIFFSASFSRLIFIFIAFIALGIFKNIRFMKPDKELLKKFLDYGIPMIGVWGVSWILSYCDRYIIALYYNSYEVGIYDMSYRIAESSINVVITAFTLAIFPILIRVWNNSGKVEVEKKLKECLKYFFILILPAITGIVCICDKLYLGILNPKYSSGKWVIILISIGMLFNGLNSIFNKVWQLNEKTKKIFRIMVISVIINIVLNILLVSKFGIEIAAITTLISYLFTSVVTYILASKEIRIIIDIKSLIKTIISCLVMSIFLLIANKFVNNNIELVIEIALGGCVYGIMSLITKNVKLEEFIKLKK